jgi:hypothetical protein
MRRFATVLATLCLVASQLVVAGVASAAGPTLSPVDVDLKADSTFVRAKSDSGAFARTDPALLGRKDATRVNVMLKYDYDATASYTGGIGNLAATSPRVTGKDLKANKTAVKAYETYTADLSKTITARAEKAAPGLDVRFTYSTAYGGVSASVPANQIGALVRTAGIAAVQEDTLQQPLDDNTSFIGATAVWPSVGGQDAAASNVIVGVIDTGVWPEHPMLAPGSLGAPEGGLRGCQFGDGTDVAHLGAAFACNNKLIGAYAKTATYMSVTGAGAEEFCNNTTHQCSPRDSEGHGTHTTTTAAGDCVTSAVLYGVERGPVCGVAPGARVIQYRVCLRGGCFGSDSVSAVQQAITDGVDVINFSISGGGNPYTDAVELAFLDAFNAGISVNASAGNSGPGAGTSDHGGPWTTTVGASTGPREFGSVLHLTADGGGVFDQPGITLTAGISSPTPVVMAATLPKAGGGNEDALCQSDLAAGAATGKIVACQRGTNGRIDKGRRVLAGGAVGMILYNPVKQDQESDNHYLPAIHIDGPSAPFTTFVTTHTNVMATWAQGTAQPGQADMMAAFSSRGPLGDWIKPDVTAPGVQVLAGTTPQPDQTTADNGPTGNLYMAIAGTSMSSPHSAGVSALVKAAHPDWSPAQIKSALMTSSVQSVVKEDGVTPADPFDMGAGSIRADRAVNPTLVFDETYADFLAAGSDPLHRIDMNIASVNAPTMSGLITTKRTATNVSGGDQDLAVSTQAPAGVSIIVTHQKPKAPPPDGSPAPLPKSDKQIHFDQGSTIDFWVTISAPEIANGQYFGRITLDPQAAGANSVTIPVAFVKKQGVVTLSHTCAPTTIAKGTGISNCTASVANFGSVPADVSLTVTSLDKGLDFTNISAPAKSIKTNDGVKWTGTLSPALAPAITAVSLADSTTTPAGGYLPLAGFGGNLTATAGDDVITNVNVPTFFFGGETYSRIGVVSNGYIVLGGGTGADINFAPQTFPDPARPNNVIAPFWSDLNTTGGGANGTIRINVLTDNVESDWIIVDFAGVKNFGNSTTHTGEIWIRTSARAHTGAAGEQVTISYGTANAAAGDPGSGINWGAENRDGTSGRNIAAAPANDTEYSVLTSPPTAGGTATITYDASAKKAGTYRSAAAMTSDQTAGTTQVVQTLTVN